MYCYVQQSFSLLSLRGRRFFGAMAGRIRIPALVFCNSDYAVWSSVSVRNDVIPSAIRAITIVRVRY